MFIDTHAHLYEEKFQADLPEVVDRAVKAGVEGIIVPGCDIDSSRQALEIAQAYQYCWGTAGIHPHEAASYSEETLPRLESLLQEPKMVALGEIGLDYFYDYATPEQQQRLFMQQLELAIGLDIPVVIHDREAHEDVWRIISPYLPRLRGVLHCFSGSWELAKRFLDKGLYLGFDGPLTFTNAKKAAEIVQKMPHEMLLLETDSPFLTPHPFRGKRNEPANLPLIAAKAAELWGIDPAEAGTITSINACKLFSLDIAKN